VKYHYFEHYFPHEIEKGVKKEKEKEVKFFFGFFKRLTFALFFLWNYLRNTRAKLVQSYERIQMKNSN